LLLVVCRRVLQQQAADLSRQLAVLLNEVQRLKTGRPGGAPSGALALPAPGAGGAVDAQAVITARLVEFRDIQVRPGHRVPEGHLLLLSSFA
jgi:hypothetical protein